jgi:ketosteroid isomerase-like protein
MAHPLRLIAAIVILGCAAAGTPGGGHPAGDEDELRALEDQERAAVLAQDFSALERIWSEDFIVNNPRNEVSANRGALLELFRKGIAHYRSFDRVIEVIRFSGDHAIVMGRETVQPADGAPLAGGTVERRFTNVWRREGATWRLFARHANVISTR